MTENVIDYQVARYAREKGLDPENITEEERENLREEMISKKYPGNFT